MQSLNNEHQMTEVISVRKHFANDTDTEMYFYKLLIGQLQITMSHIMGDSQTERRPGNVILYAYILRTIFLTCYLQGNFSFL